MPITLDGTNGITTPMYNGSITANAVTPSVNMKNRIINGAMVIDQRNAGASITPTDGQFSLDRWGCRLTQSSKYSVQQNAGSVTPPAGFNYYLGVSSLSAYSVTSTDNFQLQYRIEGYNFGDLNWGTANAKTVTISFWVRSSLTGSFGASFVNADGNRSYPFSYTISSANTWEQKTITIAGDTSGTWNTTNGRGVEINFGLGVGSTYSGTAGNWSSNFYISSTGATSVVGTNGATFYITGVQLEVGSTATSFDYRPYGTELALCQRYYFNDFFRCQGAFYSASGIVGTNRFPVTMRASPSVSLSSGTTLVTDTVGGASGTVTPSFDYITPNSLRYSGTNSVTASIGSPINIMSSTIQASAEL
jgi:hypothetical protein